MTYEHDETFERLSAYVDHELSSDEAADCERMLFTRPDSRATYRDLRALRQELAAPPVEEPLPVGLDLRLTELAEGFLASSEDAQVADEDAAAPANTDDEARPWRHIALAASMMLVALVGMSIFAQRGGAFPTLTVVDHRVSGLSEFAHELIGEHLFAHDALLQTPPPEETGQTIVLNVQQQRAASTSLYVSLPELPLSALESWRALELDGEPLLQMRYRVHESPISVYALPTQQALEEFDLMPAELEGEALCPAPAALQCHSDGIGHNLCVQPRGDVTYIWVARLPTPSLERVIESAR